MAHHILSLEIPDIMNQCIFRVADTGVYDSTLPVSCFTLEITAPGFLNPAILTSLSPNYTVNLTACDLGLQLTNCSNYNNDLQDGVYIVKQSLSPNDTLYVEYNHLRITTALNKYQDVLCSIQKRIDCDPSKETKDKIHQAQFARTLLDAAKAQVEFCHHPANGIATYKYALSLLEKLRRIC